MMINERRIGIFGVGPGSIAAIDKLGPSATVFLGANTELPRRSTYTTNKGYEALFDRYVPETLRMPMTDIRVITDSGTDFTVPSGQGYFMVDFPGLMTHWRQVAREKAGTVELLPAHLKREEIHVKEGEGSVLVNIQGKEYEFDTVIDATGTRALLTSLVEPKREDEDYFTEFLCTGTFRGEVPEGQMILVIGPGGGTSWVNRSIYQTEHGESLVDVVFSGWGNLSQFSQFKNGDGRARLDNLVAFMQQVPDINLDPNPVDLYYGKIRSQRTPKPRSETIFSVGEAGGFAKPKTGESFNRALVSGAMAADVIIEGGSPADLYRRFYREHTGDDFLLAYSFSRLEHQRLGDVGSLIDTIASWYKNGKVDKNFTRYMERFLVEGKYPPSLFLHFMRDPLSLKLLYDTVKNFIAIKFGSRRIKPSEYPFPPLSAQ